jgi:hypothetical protein
MPLSALDHAALLECLQIAERDPEFRAQSSGDNWRARGVSLFTVCRNALCGFGLGSVRRFWSTRTATTSAKRARACCCEK